MKKTVITIFFCLACYATAWPSARPMLGMTGVTSDTPKAGTLARMLEMHVGNIMRSNIVRSGSIFEEVNQETLREQLTRFDCLEDSCVLRFARRAAISVIIRGSVHEAGDSLTVTLRAMGTEVPYFGRTIYRYTARIPTTGLRLGTREYSYILEEHAARFIAGLLRAYNKPIPVRIAGDSASIDAVEVPDGTFPVHRFSGESPASLGIRRHAALGWATIRGGSIHRITAVAGGLRDGDFILANYRERADALDDYYRGRKREIVFTGSSYNDTLAMMLFTVPASLTMPLIAPVMGYYHNKDYTGLALWGINAAPYLYLEYDGIVNRPHVLRGDDRDITRDTVARYHFALYMLLCGNMALFVDAFSSNYLNLASNYQGIQQLMGNGFTAAYLSLVCGGGGHFYRGYRGWGYLYFHLNNALLYCTIREFSRELDYDEASDTYRRGGIDRRRAYTMLGAYCLFKAVETVHAVLLRDRIRNGEVNDGSIDLVPIAMHDGDRDLILGAALSMRL